MGKSVNLSLENIPKELRLILKILSSEKIETKLQSEDDLLSEVDWNLFVQQARHHRIYPLLYKKLKGVSDNNIPHFVIENLSQSYKENTFKMLHLSGEMERLSRSFLNKNVKSLNLKGPILAQDLYGDVSLRTSSDLDLLISIKDLAKVEDLMKEKGYEKDDYIETVLGDWKWRHHHITYFHPQKRIKVEVHWRLNPGPGKEPSFSELWERRRQNSLTGSPVYLLSREDLFLFLASHGARHGWSRLRWLIDMKQLMDYSLDWEKVYKLLKKFHYFSIGEQSIILATELLEANVPIQFKNPNNHSVKLANAAIFYFENMVNLHTDPVPEYIAKYHKNHVFTLLSFQRKLLFLLSLFYPYPEDMETLPLPKTIHFLYFPLRPLLWGWRKLKAVLPQRGTAL
ncbi:nucleotidyltransferase family protein [Pseudalkalibacillus hwajinpoensis]|uniref:nucleotidyltransferase domain-containing protein n=1 Tax=Guptibacillus hwajinpoensis TaxID=208199 RepID=UPI00325A8BE1